MKKISDYKVIKGSTSISFENRMREAVQNGWQPYYGISVSTCDKGSSIYAQAVVKYED
jgi:hypothetical protein